MPWCSEPPYSIYHLTIFQSTSFHRPSTVPPAGPGGFAARAQGAADARAAAAGGQGGQAKGGQQGGKK